MGVWKRNLIISIVLFLAVAAAVVYLLYTKHQRDIEEANKKAAHDALLRDLIELDPNPVYTKEERQKMQAELIYNNSKAPALSDADRQTIMQDLLQVDSDQKPK